MRRSFRLCQRPSCLRTRPPQSAVYPCRKRLLIDIPAITMAFQGMNRGRTNLDRSYSAVANGVSGEKRNRLIQRFRLILNHFRMASGLATTVIAVLGWVSAVG